jgi:hypothetical protein
VDSSDGVCCMRLVCHTMSTWTQTYGQSLQPLYEAVLGKEHPSTLTSMTNLALVLDSQGVY